MLFLPINTVYALEENYSTIYYENGYYYETIVTTINSVARSAKEGSKTVYCKNSSGKTLWSVTVNGTFTYNGSTSSCTSASVSTSVYQAEKRAVETIHDRESAVMIGRCASSILREDPNTLSVFLYAKDGNRIARIGERNNLSERAARERMEKVDRMRRHYFNFYSLSEWGKPESYDILLSTDLGLERCAETIAFLLKSKLEGNSHE